MLKRFILIFFVCGFSVLNAQINVSLNWYNTLGQVTKEDSIGFLNFEGAQNSDEYGYLPQYYTYVPINQGDFGNVDFSVTLKNQKWEPLPVNTNQQIQGMDFISDSAIIEHYVTMSRGNGALDITVIPLRKNGNVIEGLKSFTVDIVKQPVVKLKSATLDKTDYFKQSSALATGKWVKVAIKNTGIYKLTYSDINSMGLDPNTVKIYGNGGQVLDKFIANYKYDDLNEVAVWVEKGSDGVFNNGDYILFYAVGTYKWTWDDASQQFVQTQHPFSDKAYYFLTSGSGSLKELKTKPDTINDADDEVTTFVDYAVYEPMAENLLDSGDDWYGPKMDEGTTQTVSFSFPTISTNDESKVYVSYVARSLEARSSVYVNYNDGLLGSLSIPSTVSSEISIFAYTRDLDKIFTPVSSDINIILQLFSADNSATGWIDFVRVNVVRPLQMIGDELQFRYPYNTGQGKSHRFTVEGASANTVVLDVTDRLNIEKVATSNTNGTISFMDDASSLRNYVALNPKGSFPKPEVIGDVENQNLHAKTGVDMVIVSNKDFLGEGMAQDLYDMHTSEGLKVLIVTPEQIYNEFSCGQPDVTAIRWFMKMLYDRGTDNENRLKYLLIFGDGTFDNRPGVDLERNRVITFESDESLHQANTYVTDDYYGILDDAEGSLGNSDKVDIGIGRYPVYTIEEAKAMVAKSKYYNENLNRNMWKNSVTFVADDGDGNTHMRDANLMADKVMRLHPDMVVDKILLDAYQQVIDASGPSYPDANKALERDLQKGVLLLNYSGHGGITGLTDEKIVTKNMVKALSNLNNLPVWVTATCEFSRFDMKESTSAGEWVLLSQGGGGVSLFTTTRLVFSSSNYTINNNFFDYAFTLDNSGEPYRLGDICRETKSHTGTGANKRKFMLLGDPALRMLQPQLTVKTSSVNGNISFETDNDTIAALESATVSGYIEDLNGDTATFFNGDVYIKVYDKISTITTLMNDAADYINSGPLTFKLWDKAIFNGKAKVEDGKFEFEFMIPKEINYMVGSGRIVYYATSEDAEAKGYTEEIKIGGFNDNFIADDAGPELSLYLNSTGFTNGASVSSNPLFFADIVDQSGINTSGLGIGHDIMLTLDDDPYQAYILNDYFQPLIGSSEGQVRYKLSNLDEGEHTLHFRVWDIYNNSSSAELKFVVDKNDKPDITKVTCYPNPAMSYVNFEFDHNRPESVLDIQIDIFSTNGQLINTLSQIAYSADNTSNPLNWDLTDMSGRKVNRGIYFYRVRISQNGKESLGAAQKLIVN
ncbi:type IX secretion system sortase PorU [Saccharicrinis sp. FJH62]|uniref:type IX secretion system sortase PorU n=1 Tax=Saccharicrinis sp. FJH62 TaxID=3344657 RepID=UPI0035D522A5